MLLTETAAADAARDRRPTLTLRSSDAERLSVLVDNALDRAPVLAGQLLDELERAQVVADEALPAGVVAMGSEVDFRDETEGRERTVTLVYPAEAQIDAGRISILTPVGAALLGLSVGDSIDWPMRDGTPHRLRIIAVRR